MRTLYPFTLPRGYLAPDGSVHREGMMRLATGRDELEPLRDPFVTGADDPRLTVLVLARVVEKLGTITHVTPNEIEGLFAADLAFLQEFYSVVNFGDQESYEKLLSSAGRPRTELSVPTPVPAGVHHLTDTVVELDGPSPPENAVNPSAPAAPGRVPGPAMRRDAILEMVAPGSRG
ncbi:hypothetical protein KIH74_04740 [Kineosporia sp. J2-2]|uniref:Tail assembly chaperone n=1 Tax=Kineosporia corallincola TaxID=2835133 RepID=A0ABS5TAW6_9ACTN|nr:hypothetical protein [Kineosporia corallincola]MBT0768217.1 hypothetical protein [Kineosporia corallincola]